VHVMRYSNSFMPLSLCFLLCAFFKVREIEPLFD
jgi:hypothetical protein